MFNTYFDANYILSKNAIFNIVLSDRSDGKTFNSKAMALEDYEKDKSITIYMRRYKSEITPKLYESFFNEVLDVEKYSRFNEWEFKGSKNGIQVRKSKEEEWDWIVYLIPLTMTGKLKSQIADIKRIKKIVFDEYMPLDGKFIKDEISLILEFYKTVDRDRETTQMLILGNKISPFNPLFDYFDINLRIENDKVRMYKNDTLAVQIYSNKEHRLARKKGKFRTLVSDTPYEEYDCGGVLNALELKIRSHDDLDYMCSFKTERGEGTIWYNNGIMVISENLRKDGYVLVDKIYGLDRQEYLCTFGNFGKVLKHIYKIGGMFFESDKAFYKIEKILSKISAK